MAFVLGRNHKLYYQSTGTRATWPASGAAPSLVEINDAKDVTFNGDADTADVSTRGGGAFRQMVATLRDANVEFDFVYDSGDAALTFLRNGWKNGTVFGVAILDGGSATVGTTGIWMDGIITGFTWGQELEEAGTIECTIQNTFSAVPLEVITVG